MRKINSFLYLPFLLILATLATADSQVGAKVNGVEVGKTTESPGDKVVPARGACLNHCNASETRCSSEVRRARQECSRRAANGGRDPMSMRNNDYTYFCGYFGNQNSCGSDPYSQSCRNRFARTYGLCIDKMTDNIASIRHDCYVSEKDAQNYCRDELRDCKEACGPE